MNNPASANQATNGTASARKAPSGPQWAHEIKLDGYRMAARIQNGRVKLLTRSGLDSTAKYPATAAAFAKLKVRMTYVGGELCGVRPDGVTSFEIMQQVSDSGADISPISPSTFSNSRARTSPACRYSNAKISWRPSSERPRQGSNTATTKAARARFSRRAACQHGLEGIVSKRLDRPYLPGDRGAWIKTKCLNRAEFVVVGWSDPEGSRPYVGALLLGYFEPDGRLVYAVRVGTGMSQKTLATLHKRVQPRAERCLSPLPRLATTGSGGRWSWPRFIGSGPNWSPKSLI
jgi:ATP-dependent DNA ligase